MPTRARLQKRTKQQADPASKQLKGCRHCGRLFSLYKGAWKIHERNCQEARQPGGSQATPLGEISLAGDTSSSTEASSDSSSGPDDDWGVQVGSREHDVEMFDAQAIQSPRSVSSSPFDSNTVPALTGTQVWIKRHPASNQPSGFWGDDQLANRQHILPKNQSERVPLYFPFQSMDDFLQAEVFTDFGATDPQINRQLGLRSHVKMKDAKEFHETLAIAARLWGEFISEPFVTEFEGREFEHYVHYQPIFPVLSQLVGDADLAQHMVYYPEERYVHRPGTAAGSMQVREELWHGKLWWDLQNRIGPTRCILYLVAYIDETNVSTIGGVKVWPIYVWSGNLPASIRKRRGKKGGAILIGYLPKASSESSVDDLAAFRCKVYHDALNVIFESLKVPSRNGVPMRCGDGVIREFVPVIAASSADYMEFIRMICILGHNSGFPCPICLVPRLEQSKLGKVWPIRTVAATEAILERARHSETKAEKDKILHEQSLRDIRSAFLDLIPPIHSIYAAVVADPLHQIEQGIWGKHLWPWIRDSLSHQQKHVLDDRFKSIPRYPDLKHFPNGITSLKNITGKEHAVILRASFTITPLIEDMISKKYRKIVLGTFRTLAVIHILAKFTSHSDLTLEELERQIAHFEKLHTQLSATFDLSANYPKFHSLSHLTDIIRRHSTTDNYRTGLGEALHPQSKKDYRRSNTQSDYEIQMLNMYQEREAIMRIRARIDAAVRADEEIEPDAPATWDGPHVQLGSPDRNGQRLATDFVSQPMQHDSSAQQMARKLRTFLYQQVEGFQSVARVHFRESHLPLLDGMLVSVYQLLSVGYGSMLDDRDGLDVVRVTDSWRNQGPRHDYVLAQTERELFVAQLVKIFMLKARGRSHALAYVRPFKIGARNKTTGFIELTDTKDYNFIFIDSILRSCVVLSPGIRDSKHVLWDLESSDIYLRLQEQ